MIQAKAGPFALFPPVNCGDGGIGNSMFQKYSDLSCAARQLNKLLIII
jgi:hypothetical protein